MIPSRELDCRTAGRTARRVVTDGIHDAKAAAIRGLRPLEAIDTVQTQADECCRRGSHTDGLAEAIAELMTNGLSWLGKARVVH